jgi:hypothetical protein
MDQFVQERAGFDTTAIASDPFLADPLANANRKSRTVYKRSFGKSR